MGSPGEPEPRATQPRSGDRHPHLAAVQLKQRGETEERGQWTKLEELTMDTKYPVRSLITLMTNKLRTFSCSIWSQKEGLALTKGGVAIIVALLALLAGAV